MRREVISAARSRPRASAPATPALESDPSLSGLSRATLARLAKLGIAGKFDLVLHLPLRYDDETRLYTLSEAPSGEPVVVEGTVVESEVKYRPRRQLLCHIQDGSGVLTLRFFNFYPSQLKQLAPGVRVRAFGEIRRGFAGDEMVHPRYRVLRGELPVASALTPVYPATAGVGQDVLRRLIARALADCDLADTLSPALLEQLKLPPFREAVALLHNPPPEVAQETLAGRTHPAWRRVKFDELLAQQISMRLHYRRRKAAGAPALKPRGRLAQALLARLPFKLTAAQNQALAQIREDLAQPYPMQRLLQGDVGSGKTIVAALAALQCVENGRQVAIMAPTEILAEQHYRKFREWVGGLGIGVAWISGSLAARAKREALARAAGGETAVVIGTHALIQDDVRFHDLGFVIIDEQQRFGVHQRLQLRMKGSRPNKGAEPHQLMMSATPIPRTLAMSYYADLDVSVINEMPPGRGPVATRLVREARRDEVIRRVRDDCLAGGQAYWVCPLVEESDALQLRTALETYDKMRQTFPELKVGLVHGRMKGEDKARVMDAFKAGAIQLLVATTVIEVGVDAPDATLMVIENAERIGLARLHQLRGRVGRGADESTCILLYQDPLTDAARERLKIIYEQRDGFEIARQDLRLRGPGELLGARQSGEPLLRFADLETDLDLLDAAREAAAVLLREQPAAARAHLARWLGARHEYLKA
ncbi:MAG TPA: ATP-dependent DNA helicase RecG [Burkholderiales bacterium]|nr:ATP-dependent DNA helicase RecG [Burkholderiales bacterium]